MLKTMGPNLKSNLGYLDSKCHKFASKIFEKQQKSLRRIFFFRISEIDLRLKMYQSKFKILANGGLKRDFSIPILNQFGLLFKIFKK